MWATALILITIACLSVAVTATEFVQVPNNIRWDAKAWHHSARKYIPEQPKICDALFGEDYLLKWQRRQVELCSIPSAGKDDQIYSRVSCFPNEMRLHGVHSKVTHTLCVTQNSVVDTKKWLGEGSEEGEHGALFPQAPPNSIKVACNLKPSSSNLSQYDAAVKMDHENWLLQSIQDKQYAEVTSACSASKNVIKHPVLFLTRCENNNSYHHLEDIVNLFASLVILDLKEIKQHGLQVVVADHRHPGLFMETLARISHPHPVRLLSVDPFPKDTCFKLAIYNPYSVGMSMLRHHVLAGRDPGDFLKCQSSVLQGTMAWLKALYHEIVPQPYFQTRIRQSTAVHKQVLFTSRRSYEQATYHKLRGWQRIRCCLTNEDALQTKIDEALLEWNSKNCKKQVWDGVAHHNESACRNSSIVYNFRVVDFWDLIFFPDQILTAYKTSIMIGVHGAGLTHLVWMPPRSGAIVEIRHNLSNMKGALHYQLLAGLMGHQYTHVQSRGREVNITGTVRAVQGFLDPLGHNEGPIN